MQIDMEQVPDYDIFEEHCCVAYLLSRFLVSLAICELLAAEENLVCRLVFSTFPRKFSKGKAE